MAGDPAQDAANAAEASAIKSGTDAYDKAVSGGGLPSADTMKTAAKVAGAAAGVAACAATGVGVAISPLCGLAGGAIASWVGDNIGPVISDIGDAFDGLFGRKKKAPILIDSKGNVAAFPFSDLYRPTQQTHMAMLTQLDDVVNTLQQAHHDAGLLDPYDANVVLGHLHDIHGLPLITDGDGEYQVAVPDLSRKATGNLQPMMPMDFDVRSRGWLLQPPDITRDYQHINQESGSSWVQKGNEAKYIIALGLGWIDQLHVAAGREMTIILARKAAHAVLGTVKWGAKLTRPPQLLDKPPKVAHVAKSTARGTSAAGVTSGVTFLRIV